MSNETIWDALCDPFPVELVELKPGATTSDKTKALGLAYVDKRMYDERLDTVVGPENWHDLYEPWGADRVFCHLTINGITKCDVGEADAKDPNAATIAVAQAFKRACSRFGLGRYLYSLEGVWLAYDSQKKRFSGDTVQAVRQMYIKARLYADKPGSQAPKAQADENAYESGVDRNSTATEILRIYSELGEGEEMLNKRAAKMRKMSNAELFTAAENARQKAKAEAA